MSDLSATRELNKGFGDGMSRAVELALTPLIFGGIGFGIDHLAGTSPWFAIGLGLFALAGMFVRLWYGYDQEMRAHESAITSKPESVERDGGDIWDQAR